MHDQLFIENDPQTSPKSGVGKEALADALVGVHPDGIRTKNKLDSGGQVLHRDGGESKAEFRHHQEIEGTSQLATP